MDMRSTNAKTAVVRLKSETPPPSGVVPYKWTTLPKGTSSVKGNVRTRICPITGTLQCRRKFGTLRYTDYTDGSNEQVLEFRGNFLFWKIQIVAMMERVNPSEMGNAEYYLRKGLAHEKPKTSESANKVLAGVYKWLCSTNGVEASLIGAVDYEDLDGYESDFSVSSNRDIDPITQEQMRGVEQRARWAALTRIAPLPAGLPPQLPDFFAKTLEDAVRRHRGDGPTSLLWQEPRERGRQ